MRRGGAAWLLLVLTACSGGTTQPGTQPAVSPVVHVLGATITPGEGRDATLGFSAHNAGEAADRLLSASCACATGAEVVGAGNIEPEETGMFGPNGDHVLLHGLQKGLAQGDSVGVTLTFANAGEVITQAEVTAPR
ncbi:MAG: copper chaperone PCu(A)C [Actinomycetota bacterium]